MAWVVWVMSWLNRSTKSCSLASDACRLNRSGWPSRVCRNTCCTQNANMALLEHFLYNVGLHFIFIFMAACDSKMAHALFKY